jgi:hypothetical protein
MLLADMALVIHQAPASQRLPLFLAWTTSSRWDDMVHLKFRHISSHGNNFLMHFAETKTSTESDFRPDMYVPILNPPLWIRYILIQNRHKDLLVTSWSTENLRTFLHNFPPREQLEGCLPLYTGHSIKRGSQAFLWSFLALHPGAFPPSLIAMLGKHKLQWGIPQMSVRYAPDKFNMAIALDLQKLTSVLSSALDSELQLQQ